MTVGTGKEPFDRLVVAADELAARVEERTLIQKGASTYEPQYADSFRFTTGRRMEDLIQEARIVITHAGAGSILMAFKHQKPVVLVPRRRVHGEIHNDHQLELAAKLDQQKRASMVLELSCRTLGETVDKAARRRSHDDNGSGLVRALKQQLHLWSSHTIRMR